MILVTGATGTIGTDVEKSLAAHGARVRALVRNPEKAKALGAGVEIVKGDLGDAASVAAAMQGVGKLFLLVSAGPEMVQQQSNAIQAAKKAGVKQIVKLSAIGAQKGSKLSLGNWHGLTEEELKSSGVPYTILQPHSFMQNFLMQAGSVKGQGALYGASGEGKIAFIDTRDIADVAAKVLTSNGHEGKTYLLTGPEALTYGQVAEKLGKAVGKPVKYVDVPPAEQQKSLLAMGLPDWLAADLAGMSAVFAKGGGARVSSAVKDITGKLGRTVDNFARDFAKAFQG